MVFDGVLSWDRHFVVVYSHVILSIFVAFVFFVLVHVKCSGGMPLCV